MPIEFENIIHDRVLISLDNIISDEFNIPIFYSSQEGRGNSFFIITIENDSLLERGANFEAREYTLNIIYNLKIVGTNNTNTFKQISNIAERCKKLISNNSSYSLENTYKWHDAQVNSIQYNENEDNEDLSTAIIEFNCVSTEVC